jgi:hypothetical protein
MDEDKIAEQTQQQIAKTDEETRQLIAKVGKRLKGPAEIALVGSTAIVGLAAAPGLMPGIAAVMGFGAYLWQRENQNDFLRKLEQQIHRTDAKLNVSTLKPDEFMELFIQAMEIASNSASELKRQALANALVNSVIPPTSQFIGKLTLLRILSQLSDEEIQVLRLFWSEFYDWARSRATLDYEDVSKLLKWDVEEARAICDGLIQLGLARYRGNGIALTALAEKLVKWVKGEVLPVTATEANTPESADSAEKTRWSKLTAEQFFSGYSEADAIYDTI